MKCNAFFIKTLLIFSLFLLIAEPINFTPQNKLETNLLNISTTYDWFSIWSRFDDKIDEGIDVAIDTNDDIIMGGRSINTSYDHFVAKYDDTGVQLWNDTQDGGNQDWFRALAVSGTDIYVGNDFYNQTRYEAFLGKYDGSGNYLWNISWIKDGASGAYTRDMALSQTGDFYFTGEMAYGSSPSYTYQYFVVKLDSSGIEVWNSTFDVQDSTRKNVYGITTFDDLVYIFGQYRNDSRNENDPLIVCISATTGIQLWNKTWQMTGYNEGRVNDVIVDSSGNIYATGYYGMFTNCELFLRKYSPSSDLIWERTYQDISSQAFGIALEDDSSIFLSGSTKISFSESSALLVKYSSNGTLLGKGSWEGDTATGSNRGYNVEVDSTGNVYMVGVTPGISSTDAFIIKNLELLAPGGGGGAIPSFNFWFLLSILGCTILFLMRKYRLKIQ
jgi:hypothetical protein